MTLVVVGAGLAGLAAAWEIRQTGTAVVVLEGGDRAGGVVVTERPPGFVVEGGPDGFLAAEPDIQELARELALDDQVVDQRATGAALWTGRRLEPLAEGRAAALLGIQGHGDEALSLGFRSFAGGMAVVVEALVDRLAGAVRRHQGVTAVVPARRGWRLAVTGGSTLEAEGVILAVPGWVAARLLAGVGVPAGRALDEVVYLPSVTVSLAYRAAQVPADLVGAGFVSGGESGALIRACSYSSRKYPCRAPDGAALLRAFVAPADGDPGALAHAELAPILGLQGAPLWTRAFHWPRGLPRYKPGHAARVAAIRDRLQRLAPLEVAGAAVDGASVSACVKSGREAARRVLARAGGAGGAARATASPAAPRRRP
ncbi:MAG TPA: FAD-dependent oxidoreductase [Gemmatimonadales bacterium]|nr:FAD-dependent oxidoreductase [Gemmatimonadales bacterium]